MIVAPDTLVQNRFRIIRQIGQGKMGAVYEAFDEHLSQTVALKQTLTSGDQFSKAFEREARILASLRHPVLPIVIDHFTNDDGQFMVMDFIPGKDLGELLRQRGEPFPVHVVLKWADQVLHALEYLHRQKPPIIHRDIKPQNLKLTAEGQIILLDFGLAKGRITPDARDYQLPTAQKMLSLVATGTVETDNQEFSTDIFGFTRQYAPLEQIQGTGTDARSDIYALAATLYQLLTGAPPIEALKRINALGYDNYSHYEAGLEKLRIHMEQRQITHDEVAKQEQLLRENIDLARLYGDNPTSQETRSDTIDHLDVLTRDILGLSFNKLCRLDIPIAESHAQNTQHHTPSDPLMPVHDVNPSVPQEIGTILHQALALTPDYRPTSAEAMRTKLLTAQRAWQQTTQDPETNDSTDYPPEPFLPPHPEPPEPGGFDNARKRNKSVGLLIAVIIIILIAQIYLVVTNRQKMAATRFENNTSGQLANLGTPIPDTSENIALTSVKNIQPVAIWTGQTNDVQNIAFSPDSTILASGSLDETILLYQVADGTLLQTFNGRAGSVQSIAFAQTGTILLSGSTNNSAHIWQVRTGENLHTLNGHTGSIKQVAITPDSQIAVTGSTDHTVRLWAMRDGTLVRTLTAEAPVHVVATSPDNKLVAAGTTAATVHLWNIRDGTLITTLEGHSASVESLVFTPDGEKLFSGSTDSTIVIWRVKDGKRIRTIKGHSGQVHSLALDAHGHILASGSSDATIRLWRVKDGKLLNTLEGHQGIVLDIAFSPDNRLIASCSEDDTIRLWGIIK